MSLPAPEPMGRCSLSTTTSLARRALRALRRSLRAAVAQTDRTIESFCALYIVEPWDAIIVRCGTKSSYALRAQRREAIRALVDLDAERGRILTHIDQIDAAIAAHQDEELDAALRKVRRGSGA